MLPKSHNILCSEGSVDHYYEPLAYRSGRGNSGGAAHRPGYVCPRHRRHQVRMPAVRLSRHPHPCPYPGGRPGHRQTRGPLYHHRPAPRPVPSGGADRPGRPLSVPRAPRPAAAAIGRSRPGGGAGQRRHDPRRRGGGGAGAPAGHAAHGPFHAPAVRRADAGGGPGHRRAGPHGGGDAGADPRRGGPPAPLGGHRHRRAGRPQSSPAVCHRAAGGHGPDPRQRRRQSPQGGQRPDAWRAGHRPGRPHGHRRRGPLRRRGRPALRVVCHAPGHRPPRP